MINKKCSDNKSLDLYMDSLENKYLKLYRNIGAALGFCTALLMSRYATNIAYETYIYMALGTSLGGEIGKEIAKSKIQRILKNKSASTSDNTQTEVEK